MRLAVCFVLAAAAGAACQAPEDDYPKVPGSGPPRPMQPGTPGVDAGADAPDGGEPGAPLLGRVCRLLDARDVTSCSPSGVGGLTVTLGAHTAQTAQDGAFEIERPAGTSLVWHVTGPTIAPSLMPLSATHVIPVLDAATHEDLLLGHGVLLEPDRGIAFVRVVRGGQPVPGVTAQIAPPTTAPARYDGVTSSAWTEAGTGVFGMIWLAGVLEGAVDVTVVPPVNAPITRALPIAAGTATYTTIELP